MTQGILSPTKIPDLIRQRSSYRKYLASPLEEAKKARFLDGIAKLPPSCFASLTPDTPPQTRFQLVEFDKIDPEESKQLGTYGFIRGARHFLVGVCIQSPFDLEDYAYKFELLVLLATELDWGTCWLGGTFNKSGFSDAIHMQTGERVPAVSPIGPIPEKRGLIDRMMRASVKANQRQPWEKLFFEGSASQPLSAETSGTYREILDGVRLAPSARNGQPWRIVKENNRNIFHFYAEDPRPDGGLTQFRRLDLGIAAAHFDLLRQTAGISGVWSVNNPTEIMNIPLNWIYRFTFSEK
jgi:nitroreductase